VPRRKRPANEKLEPTYLTAWREFRDKSLEQVGKNIKLDKSALSRIETQKSPYDQFHLQQLSREYGVSIPDLLYTDPKRHN
jgi:transcriptional regulator with XRE-family HTH domain